MSKQIFLKYCSKCAKNDDMPGAKFHINGYKSFYDSDDYSKCLECGNELIQYSMTCDEYNIITHISQDVNFLEAMIKLKDTDIIEYESRMSQFRSQVQQQEEAKQKVEEKSKPHCPTCGSTNIEKISATSKAVNTIVFGIFGTKRHKSFHCNNCKYEW